MEPTLETITPEDGLWDRVFVVSPLVLVGTREEDGGYDLAPKHQATPIGWGAYFGFVCTPQHRTWQNAKREKTFTVSYPRPSQVLLSSFAAAPRCEDGAKPALAALPTMPARVVEGVLLRDATLHLECELDRLIPGFGVAGLIVGRIVAAHVDERALRSPDRDDADLIEESPLLAFLPPSRFAEIKDTNAYPFHAGTRY